MGSCGTFLLVLVLTFAAKVLCEDDTTMGPMFIKEPENRVDFSNTTGAVVECTARGSPRPEIIWIRADGTAVGDVPGLRQVKGDGNLVFPPFRAEDYRQEVHAQVYICMAKNRVGVIHSRDVNVRAVIAQNYEIDVIKEFAIRGNSAVMKCQVPSYVSDFVHVISWITEDSEYTLGSDYVVTQFYDTDVNKAYAIRGNSAIMKCETPSYVADFLMVVSWHTDGGDVYYPGRGDNYAVSQYYEVDVNKEPVIKGNSVVMKCGIPSFVADFVTVVSWSTDKGDTYYPGVDYVIEEPYRSEVNNEYVIRGNSVVLKCSIPPFIVDFVTVVSWQDDSGNVFQPRSFVDGKTIVNQPNVIGEPYRSDVSPEYAIRGNSVLFKCSIPPFVADFVSVVSWIDDVGNSYFNVDRNEVTDYVIQEPYRSDVGLEYVIRANSAVMKCGVPPFVADFVSVVSWQDDAGNVFPSMLSTQFINVVTQNYFVEVNNEHVIRGNSAVVKCSIPSFVADFVFVFSWNDNTGNEYSIRHDSAQVVAQYYASEVVTEYVIRGNTAILKCAIPSFVTDFVVVNSWISSDGQEYRHSHDGYVVIQNYVTGAEDEYVILGNTAVVKCKVPSFVADFVTVESWTSSDGREHRHLDEGYVVNQNYESELMPTEYVIRGNSAIMKCNVPSFVADFITVDAWVTSDGQTYSRGSAEIVVMQNYITEAENEYVIRGNSAVVKCKIPSFVADFVSVDAWIDDSDTTHTLYNTNDNNNNNNYLVHQAYEAEADNEYVIKGNSAIMKCEIPSFVADFVSVAHWIDSLGKTYYPDRDYVVNQFYQSRVIDEYVLLWNSVVLKCLVPSFVTDFVQVLGWVDDNGNNVGSTVDKHVVEQSYQLRVNDEFVLKGNTAVLKCIVPSFMGDFLEIVEWVSEAGEYFVINQSAMAVGQYYEAQVYDMFVIRGNTAIFKCSVPSFVSDYVYVETWEATNGDKYFMPNIADYVVSQFYEAILYDMYVIRGNTAIFKCIVPSFVADYVSVVSWEDTTAGNEYSASPGNELFVVNQLYTVNVMDESVLRGNAALLKCHIPSFVADYVFVSGWTSDDGDEYSIDANRAAHDGKYLVLPSGELHIRDVTPEDGTKSYQCRTKHRLTGETRLSATKGRLVITDPVGSSSPKFASLETGKSYQFRSGQSFVLTCSAQSHPVPTYRSYY